MADESSSATIGGSDEADASSSISLPPNRFELEVS